MKITTQCQNMLCINFFKKADWSNMKKNKRKKTKNYTNEGWTTIDFKKCNDSGMSMINTDLEPPSNSRCIGLIVFLMVWRFWIRFPVLWPVVGSLNISYRVRYIVFYCSCKQIMVFIIHYTICENGVIYCFITSKRNEFFFTYSTIEDHEETNTCSFHIFLVLNSTLSVSMLLILKDFSKCVNNLIKCNIKISCISLHKFGPFSFLFLSFLSHILQC